MVTPETIVNIVSDIIKTFINNLTVKSRKKRNNYIFLKRRLIAVFIKYYFPNMTGTEIGNYVGISRSAISNTLRVADYDILYNKEIRDLYLKIKVILINHKRAERKLIK